MTLRRWKKIHKKVTWLFCGMNTICLKLPDIRLGKCLISVRRLIWARKFQNFQNLANFFRTKNIFILGRFSIFFIFWKAMRLKVTKMRFMFSGDMPNPPPQRKREAGFRKNPGWAPDLMCTSPLHVVSETINRFPTRVDTQTLYYCWYLHLEENKLHPCASSQ